jgi:hypothetical protein
MKIAAALSLLAASASAFAPASKSSPSTSLSASEFSVDSIAGAVAPFGIFDPLGFAEKADAATLKRYREAELVST